MEKKRISVTLTKSYIDGINEMKSRGFHLSNASVIMAALKPFLKKNRIAPFYTGGKD